jgi:hypothetical protein
MLFQGINIVLDEVHVVEAIKGSDPGCETYLVTVQLYPCGKRGAKLLQLKAHAPDVAAEIQHALKNTLFGTTMQSLLKNISTVGSDVEHRGSVITPSIVVDPSKLLRDKSDHRDKYHLSLGNALATIDSMNCVFASV